MLRRVVIPKQGSILSSKIRVSFNKKECDLAGAWALAVPDYGKIYLNPDIGILPEDKIYTIFLHELLHHCFAKLGYMRHARNEVLVEGLANALSQFFLTSSGAIDFKEQDE